MAPQIHTTALIIGAGAAGYTAAIYAARANLHPVVIEGMQPGGQLMITGDVENYPGFAETIQGPWLMEQMTKQASLVGAQLVADIVTEVDFDQRPFRAVTDLGDIYTADAVIVATGAQARWLGLQSEAEYRSSGVSVCATCDGFFFRGKDVAVVGGGNTAVEEALYLTKHAAKVTLVHRRDRLRADKILQGRLFDNCKIDVVWDSAIDEILGNPEPKEVSGVRIRNVKSGETSVLPVQGVFVAIGHDPANALFRGKLDLDDHGYIKIGCWSTKTSKEGVFAAGDVADPKYRQVVTAAGMGCMAALEAEKWLAEQAADPGRRQRKGEHRGMISA